MDMTFCPGCGDVIIDLVSCEACDGQELCACQMQHDDVSGGLFHPLGFWEL